MNELLKHLIELENMNIADVALCNHMERIEKLVSKETAYEFVKAVLRYRALGELPDEEAQVWVYGLGPQLELESH